MWGDSGWVCWVRYLKVAVPRHFFHFFHESNLSRPLINRLKRFCRKVPFRGDIREISDFSLTSTARSWIFLNLKFEYLRENEFLSKSILDCYSGFQVDFFMKKCQKILWHCHFKKLGHFYVKFNVFGTRSFVSASPFLFVYMFTCLLLLLLLLIGGEYGLLRLLIRNRTRGGGKHYLLRGNPLK